MTKFFLKSYSTFFLVFLLISSLLISENVCSRRHWTRDYFKVSYNKDLNAIDMIFEYFDFTFGPANENGYLENCDYSYSSDSVNFHTLMTSVTDDQPYDYLSWIIMKNKLPGTQLQLIGCAVPPEGTMWPDSTEQKVEVYNTDYEYAYLTIRWLMDKIYHDIVFIRIIGLWHINGIWPNENFEEVYSISCKSVTKPEHLSTITGATKPNFNTITSTLDKSRIFKQGGDIVINGAEPDKTVNIYNTAGIFVKSIITKRETIKIKLPENERYIVYIGVKRFIIIM